MTYVLLLAFALFITYRATTAAERQRYFRATIKALGDTVRRAREQWNAMDSFRDTLRARTTIAPVMPAIVAINVIAFAAMVLAGGSVGDPGTLLQWGGNFGPRTANGEWWRLVTSLFLNSSFIHLFVSMLVLAPAGLVLERLVGPITFAAVYVASGVFSSLFTVSVYPIGVNVGPAGAIAGVYGLLLAVSLWGIALRPTLTLPLVVVKWLTECATLFVVYVLLTDTAGVALVGFGAGLWAGLVVARDVNQQRTPMTRLTATASVMLCVAVLTAVPLRGITDATRHVQDVVALEERTAASFRTATAEFTAGRMSDKTLADVIDTLIVPELRDAQARFASLQGIPQEQRPLVAAAEEYLQLRDDSWMLRAQALRSGQMKILKAADEKETAALGVFQRLR